MKYTSLLTVTMQVLRKLNLGRILGITATARKPTAMAIAKQLKIEEENVVYHFHVPGNLRIAVLPIDYWDRDEVKLH